MSENNDPTETTTEKTEQTTETEKVTETPAPQGGDEKGE